MALTTRPGTWQPPPSVIASGTAAYVTYRYAPFARDIDRRYRGLTRTQLPISVGIRKLRAHLVARFPQIYQTYMPGRSRVLADGQRLDTHQGGVAVDCMIRMHGSAANLTDGSPVADYVCEKAEAFGVQFVVWAGNKMNLGAARGSSARFGEYGGAIKHLDHPHIELCPEAARGELAFYRDSPAIVVPGFGEHDPDSTGPEAPYEELGGLSPAEFGLAVGGTVVVLLGAVYLVMERRGAL